MENENAKNAESDPSIDNKSSAISGFHKLTPAERRDIVKHFASLDEEEVKLLEKTGALSMDSANRMIENVVGTTQLPIGIATNFLINGKDYLISMSIEEPSVVAAASYAAKLAREAGGFKTSSTDPIMIGQIQIVRSPNPDESAKKILDEKEALLKAANDKDPILVKFGGGARGLEVEVVDSDIIR